MPSIIEFKDHFEIRDGLTYRIGGDRPLEHLASGSHGYINVTLSLSGRVYQVLLHRLKFYLANGWWPDRVDHRNLDRRDNRLSNLRAATHSQNMQNVSRPPGKLPRGVCFVRHAKARPYNARPHVGGKAKSLGYYATPEEASEVVERTLREVHGEFYRDQGT